MSLILKSLADQKETMRVFQECEDEEEPKSFRQAINSFDSENWLNAMKEELNSIHENETWILADLPDGRRAIGSKWVFKRKFDENGKVSRFKARLVAQGFSQRYGIDYDECFAPVVRSSTIRLFLSVAGMRGLLVNQYDVATAFLNGELNEEIYMKQPPGFENGSKVLLLKKSLYGLKQAARAWNEALHRSLLSHNFVQCETDHCLYTLKSDLNVCYLLVHVDDVLVASDCESTMDNVMKSISKTFKLEDLGPVKHFLSIDIERNSEGNFMLPQPNYIDKIVACAKLTEAKDSKYPVDTGYYKLTGKLLSSNEEYRKLIGMLLYLTTNTRPDIAATVSILSQKITQPRDVDLKKVKRVVRYLKGTRDLTLQLSDKNERDPMFALTDANWAEDRVDRKSNSGFYCSINGGAISWSCRKQSVVALSSAESEFYALSETVKEMIWLKRIATCFDINVPHSLNIYTDSQSVISMLQNQNFSHRTKHIDTKHFFVKEMVSSGEIKLIYTKTEDNIADMMTKPLGSIKLKKHREKMLISHLLRRQQVTN
jgi:Reverse transcriptase (RNA-dependent DNA polymerase)